MTTLTPQQIADLKASIAKKYDVVETDDGLWCVIEGKDWDPLNDKYHDDPLDAEAAMEAIIQDELADAIPNLEDELAKQQKAAERSAAYFEGAKQHTE